MPEEWAGFLDLAQEYAEAAQANLEADRRSAAYSEARHAAELAAKATLQLHGVEYPLKKHNIAGSMGQAGLIPPTILGRDLSRLLQQHTRGEYGHEDVPTSAEVQDALEIARTLMAAVQQK